MSEVIALPSQVATEAEFDGVPVDLVEAFKRDQERAKKATDWLSSATPDQLAAFEAFQTIQAAEQAKKAEAKQKAEAEKAAKAQKAEDEKAAKQEAAERARQGAAGTEMTDAVLSQRVSDSVMAGLHCWSASLGWMTWHRTHWERSNSETVIENVRKFMLDSVTKELRSPDTDWRKRQELMSLLSKSRINAIVELCKGITQVRDDMFDSHPDLLNTLNCVVNLRTGEVRQHDPAFYFTKVTPVPYIKGATHPDWDMALQAVPEKAREWFQVRAGQGITGHMTPDDVLLMLQGGGENGKSTVLDAIGRAIGPGYKVGVSDRVLLAEAGAHPTELMDFRGARFAVAEELPEGRRMSVKRLKDVIGTPTMKARYMRQDTVEWDSTHSMFLSTNYLPVIEETDHGTWRR
ncbi:phage/plasmid primase, P4 family, partial [Kitasatospora sp. HPMI-4]|uniref:phage/plasmid primase, P4 family n=1 Tax=Kitasatospora sp. HPMI-4 TaxID=3448443 RepID=UPI003F1E27ED